MERRARRLLACAAAVLIGGALPAAATADRASGPSTAAAILAQAGAPPGPGAPPSSGVPGGPGPRGGPMGGRGMHYRDYRGGYGHHSWWWLVPIVLFKLALFALVVLACLWLARSLRSPAAGAPGAREVLDHRLAEGEISVGEHEQRAARLDPAG